MMSEDKGKKGRVTSQNHAELEIQSEDNASKTGAGANGDRTEDETSTATLGSFRKVASEVIVDEMQK